MVAIRKIDAFLLLFVHFEDLRTQNGEICEWSDGRFRFYFSVKRASNNPHMGVGYCTVDGSTVQSTVDSCTFDGEEVCIIEILEDFDAAVSARMEVFRAAKKIFEC